MNILIIGDSWGVPNYHGSPGVDPKYHTEWLLRKKGYNILNFSINGGNNRIGIDRAYHLSNSDIFPVDWILWFHTEPLRELFHNQYNDNAENPDFKFEINEFNEKILRNNYEKFNEAKTLLNCKVALIGGQAPVHPCHRQYFIPEFLIEDWRSDILGYKLPVNYMIGQPHWLDLPNCTNSIEEKLSILNDIKTIRDSMQAPLFPDCAHPGIKPHADLEELLATKVFV